MRSLFYFLLQFFFISDILNAHEPPKSMTLEEYNLSINEIDRIAEDALHLFNVHGASVSIVFNDQKVFSRGYGFRDLDKKLPVTERTLFSIGSCTKAFTALALGLLVDEGKLAWDDPVQKHIPEFYLSDKERTARLTIRDLLGHRTGLARHDPIWFFSEISRGSVIELLKKFEPQYELRQEFQYNNFMYTVAGIIIERISGQSWENFISSHLLNPLEMKNSVTSIEELQLSSNFSLPYAEINGINTEIPFHNAFAVNPSGGIHANGLDMANWLKLQLGQGKFEDKAIIQRETLEETHKIQMLLPPPNENEKTYYLGYGLGWFIGKFREYDLIGHGGDIDGFSSEVAFLHEKGIGIVILTNSSSNGRAAVSSIRNQIFDKILGKADIDWVSKIQAVHKKANEDLKEALKLQDESRQTSSTEPLAAYPGCYSHPAYGNVVITIENNCLFATFGRIKTPLHFKSEGLFTGKFFDLLFYGINPFIDFNFFKDSSEIVYKIEIPFERFRGAKSIPFTRINPDGCASFS